MSSILYHSVLQVSAAAVSVEALQASGVSGHELQPDIWSARGCIFQSSSIFRLGCPIHSLQSHRRRQCLLYTYARSLLGPAVLAVPHAF